MSASPKTAVENSDLTAPASTSLPLASSTNSSAEALQSLLAFSALHQQIRHRHTFEKHESAASGPPAGHLEHFVLDEVLQLVAARALAITGADGVAIALAEGNAIVCRAVAGKVTPDVGARLDPNSGFSGACLSSREVTRCDDSETDPRVNAAACRALGTRSMVAVPLPAKQTIIGLVEAFSNEPYGFNDSDVRSLTLMAELILAALRPEEEDRLAEISQRVVVPPAGAVSVAELTGQDRIVQDQSSTNQSKPARPEESQPEVKQSNLPAHAEETTPVLAAAPLVYSGRTNSRPGLAVVVALILGAAALGMGLWWSMHRNAPLVSEVPGIATQAALNPAPQPQVTATPAAETTQPDLQAPVPVPTAPGERPQVTGIRHWSAGDTSTVVIDLQDQVQYEAHRLSNPERIYVDLPDTRLVAALFNKTIDVGDVLLQRVRVSQPTHGVTRVVLETKGASNFSVSLEPNPYRVVIEVRTIGAEPRPRTKVQLFGPDGGVPPQLHAPQAANGTPGSRLNASDPKFRIVLDAGHGGWDLGTVGRKGLLEKDLVLDIVERLGKLVEKRLAAAVIYTRTDDNYVALEKRAEVANLARANLFLSVHANYSDFPSARGVETYYTNTYSSIRARSHDSDVETMPSEIDWTKVDIREKVHQSRRLAASIQRALYGTLSASNPGLPNRGVKQAQYVVLTGTSMPAVLAEVSFVSSPTDENNLQSSGYRERIAEALYQGVARYAEQNRVKMASVEKPVGQ